MSSIAKSASLPATQPDWRYMPSADDLAAAYPKKAQTAEVEGQATIQCTVAVDGQLNDCKVVQEKPAGYGFGEAALSVAPSFQMDPAIRDGVPHTSTVRIPIAFKLPPPQPHTKELSPLMLQAHPVLALIPFVAVLAIFALNDWVRGRRGAPTVKVWPAVANALRFVVTAWRRAPGPLAICVVLGAARVAVINAEAAKFVDFGLMFLLIVADIFAYGACYRIALRDLGVPEPLRLGPFGFQAGAVERRMASLYLVFAAAGAGFLIVAAIICAVVVALVDHFVGQTARDVTAVVMVAGFATLLLYLLARCYTTPVSVVLHGSSGYMESWRSGRAAIFSPLMALGISVLALVILIVAANVVTYLVGMALHLGADLRPRAVALVVAPFVLPFSAGLTAWFYRSLNAQATREA